MFWLISIPPMKNSAPLTVNPPIDPPSMLLPSQRLRDDPHPPTPYGALPPRKPNPRHVCSNPPPPPPELSGAGAVSWWERCPPPPPHPHFTEEDDDDEEFVCIRDQKLPPLHGGETKAEQGGGGETIVTLFIHFNICKYFYRWEGGQEAWFPSFVILFFLCNAVAKNATLRHFCGKNRESVDAHSWGGNF